MGSNFLPLSIKSWSAIRADVIALNEGLVESCKEGHLEIVKWMIENTSVNANYSLGPYTPLTAACSEGHIGIVTYLVKKKCSNINLPDREGNTPLSLACYWVHVSVSAYLLREVDDVCIDFRDNRGNTLMHYAV